MRPLLNTRRRTIRRIIAVTSLLVLAVAIGLGQRRLHLLGVNITDANYTRGLGIRVDLYAQDHGGHFPALADQALLGRQLAAYGGDDGLTIHPPLEAPGTGLPYQGNLALSGRSERVVKRGEEVVLLYQARPFHGRRRVLLWDATGGSLAWNVPEAQWQERTGGGRVLAFAATGAGALVPD